MSKIRQLGRTTFSVLPKLGLMPRPDAFRPSGVSMMMPVKDEEDWVEKAILSVLPFVEEIVVVDNGSDDRTPEVVGRITERYPGRVRFYHFAEEDFCGAVNLCLRLTKFSTVFRWNGDFVGRTSGPCSMRNLLSRIRSLDRNRYYAIWLGGVGLDGDLRHQLPVPGEVEREPHVFTHHPRLHYRQSGRFEEPVVPYFYKRLEWKEQYFFHLRSVKPARRLLYRYFWTRWMSLPEKSQFPTLDSFVRHSIRERYGTSDINVAMKYRVRDLCRDVVPYDRERFGDYPEILDPDLLNPKYQLIYKDGLAVSRNDVELITD